MKTIHGEKIYPCEQQIKNIHGEKHYTSKAKLKNGVETTGKD